MRSLFVSALAMLTLAGCVSFSADGGMHTVSDLVRERTGQDVRQLKTEDERSNNTKTVNALLARDLSPESAVRIALLNNRGLQAALAELGVAEADLVQAGRLRNPSFSFGRLRGGDDVEIDRSILFDIGGLLTMPIRSDIERRRFEQAKLTAAAQAVQLAGDTLRAYYRALAARQTLHYMEQVGVAAEAAAELAQRMRKAGNWSKLAEAREQVFHADAVARITRARHEAIASGEQLARLLGLEKGSAAYKLPQRLPDLPRTAKSDADIEVQTLRQRLDLQSALRDTEATASALGLTRATGFINVLDAGYANKSASDKPRANGYEVSLELPLFDWGGARVAKAEALYMQAVQRAADAAIRAQSEAREAYSAYRASYDLARHYRDDVVPLRKKISDEVLLRYNGMLTGVFDLLADAREQMVSVNAAIEAQRDFWIAEADLQAALSGSGGGTSASLRVEPAAASRQAH
ncbi:MAG: TolC family protein [Proteobacteria bacterium]|nr:TolC family protein [Pseudomonadota bacterium]